MLLTSQYSEFAHQKQPQMRFKQSSLRELPKNHFRTAVGLSMGMKHEREAGYI